MNIKESIAIDGPFQLCSKGSVLYLTRIMSRAGLCYAMCTIHLQCRVLTHHPQQHMPIKR